MTAQTYLAEHGITEKTVKEYNIFTEGNYLQIPVKDTEGNEVFIKGRNLNYTKDGTEPKYKNSANSHATLFNYHNVKASPIVVICEGEMDCMRLAQAGIPAVTSTAGAGTFLEEWVALLEDKTIFICLDTDSAGQKGTVQLLEYFPEAKVITLEDAKDVCEYLQTHTKKDFANLIKTAKTKQEYIASIIPEDFATIKLSELVSMDFPQAPWLIDRILYNEGFCFIYGAEGTGKSFLALTIAQAVATGQKWLGHFTTPRPVNVLVLDKENPLSVVAKRAKGLSITSENIHYLQYPEKFQIVDNSGNYSEFAKALAVTVQTNNIGLIVIDSFVDFMLGSESSAQDTQMFFNALRELFPKIAFVAIHHENKPSQGVFRNDSQRLRGSSNINAQTFTAFRLEPVAKSKTEMTLKQVKARDALKLDKFMIRMLVTNNVDDTTTVSGFEYIGEIIETEDTAKADEVKDMIEEILTAQKIVNRRQIVELGAGKGISESTIKRAIKTMLDEGSINEIKKGKEKWYTLGLFISKNNEIEDIEDEDIL